MISENIVNLKFQLYLKRENSQLTAGNRDCLASSTIFRRRRKWQRAWYIYHSFWQIEQRRATRGIGFSQKIDFPRVVVRLALAGGFTAADPISLPPRFSISPLSLRVTQPPLRQATANWTCPAHCCCIHSWYGWRTISHGETAWVEPHTAGCVFLIFILCTLPAGIVLSFRYRSIREMHCIPYIHVRTESRRRLLGGNVLIIPLRIFLSFIFNSSAVALPEERQEKSDS